MNSSQLINNRWIYVKRPESFVSSAHYQLECEEIDTQLVRDELLLANKFVSVDPYMRIQQAESHSWEAPHPLNTLQQACVVSQVIGSHHDQYQIGDWVSCYSGWETYSKVNASAVEKLQSSEVPMTSALGVLGMPGRTAWFGLMEAGRPKPGDTVVVSGAAGAVGSLVVQFAKKAGCKVVAFAGSQPKCHWLSQSLKVDHAINYKDFADYHQLKKYLNELGLKVDIYFDNVGGMISDAVIPLINKRARIVICGQMSQYNGQLDQVEKGPRFLHHMLYQRATIQGILARDYSHRMDEMVAQVSPWIKDKSLVFSETIVEGFEHLPDYMASLFDRQSVGKLIVKIAH